MDRIAKLMQIIDENSNNISEGDYLKICNILKTIYRDKEGPKTLIDYETFTIVDESQTDEINDHFYDYFYNMSVLNEINYAIIQRDYLETELYENRPIKRINKNVKLLAIGEFCKINNILLSEYTEKDLEAYLDRTGYDLCEPGVSFTQGIKRVYKSYMTVENIYRQIYRNAIQKKISELDSLLDKLEDM